MIEDSAQRRREANSGYRLEAMGSLSQNRGQLDAEYEFQSPGSFLNRSGRYENSGYQFEPLNSYPDRRHEGNFGSQFPPMSSFPSPNRRDENSDYRFEPLAFSAHLYDEDIEEDELSKKYIPREKFHVQRSGIKDPAPVGGNDEVRRRVFERLGPAVARDTAESHGGDNIRISEEDARKGRYKYNRKMTNISEYLKYLRMRKILLDLWITIYVDDKKSDNRIVNLY
ncbi:hypothetical protein ACHAO8_001760 [Botrytis cinerea]